MALRRWAWLWGPVAGAAFVVVLLLPTGGQGVNPLLSFLWGPAGREYVGSYRQDVRRAAGVQRARLTDARRADSLIAAARGPRALRSRDGRTVLVYERPLSETGARAWLNAAERELARYPAPDALGGRLIVAVYTDPARARQLNLGLWPRSARRLPPDSPTAPCITEVNLVTRGPGGPVRSVSPGSMGPFLGLCGLIRSFGAPGPGVARWIGSAGWRAFSGGDGGWMATLSEAGRPTPRIEVQRPDLSNDRPWEWYWGTPWVAIGCLDGTWSLCERNVRLRSGDYYYYWWGYSEPQTRFVAHLLATGTPEQFARFWHSPLGVRDALRQAYGKPAGQLAGEALGHWYSTAPGGPRAGARLLLAGLFWAGAALAVALVAGRRQTTAI